MKARSFNSKNTKVDQSMKLDNFRYYFNIRSVRVIVSIARFLKSSMATCVASLRSELLEILMFVYAYLFTLAWTFTRYCLVVEDCMFVRELCNHVLR